MTKSLKNNIYRRHLITLICVASSTYILVEIGSSILNLSEFNILIVLNL